MAHRYSAQRVQSSFGSNAERYSILCNGQHTGIEVVGGAVAHLALRVARALNREASRAPRRTPRRPSLASGQLSVARRTVVRDLFKCLRVA